jgi:hypothetical protein
MYSGHSQDLIGFSSWHTLKSSTRKKKSMTTFTPTLGLTPLFLNRLILSPEEEDENLAFAIMGDLISTPPLLNSLSARQMKL